MECQESEGGWQGWGTRAGGEKIKRIKRIKKIKKIKKIKRIISA